MMLTYTILLGAIAVITYLIQTQAYGNYINEQLRPDSRVIIGSA